MPAFHILTPAATAHAAQSDLAQTVAEIILNTEFARYYPIRSSSVGAAASQGNSYENVVKELRENT